MHVVRLDPPKVAGQAVSFTWTVEPATSLYRQTSFSLEFPASVDLTAVPTGLWWRIAITCLHPHWVLLRPCRVVLPVRLGPGEREFWLRLCDAATWSLEVLVDGRQTARAIDLVESGAPLAPLAPGADSGLTAACFSGGRDSLTQTALLQELGERPLLVTTASPREGSVEHETARRRQVMDEIVRRRGVELVEVRSDLRAACDNSFAGERYGTAVSELGDCLLYFGAALAVAAARGARRIVLASEAEVQESARWNGLIVQQRHFMYSAVTQRALQALLEPTGIRYGGLTSALHQFQVQRLLASRYGDLRQLQYSCWELTGEQAACSACRSCAGIAFNLMADGVSPSVAGIDVATVLRASEGWRPGGDRVWRAGPAGQVTVDIQAQLLRCMKVLPAERVAPFVDDRKLLAAYVDLRSDVLAQAEPLEPEPGYRAAFLELVDEPLRSGLVEILAEHFVPVRDGSDVRALERTLTLSDWIAAPLRDPALDRRRRPAGAEIVRAVRARPAVPPPLTSAELDPIRHNLPGPEPVLGPSPHGRALPVADTQLDGNERRYLNECVDSNYVSSTGAFVGRFERAFAAATGSAHAVACSSGAVALQLAYAAAGVGPGDEVVMPAFTMIATANAASHLGARPVFVDTDAGTWNLDVDRVAEAIGPRTRAVVAVHTYGQPADPGPLRRLAERNGLALIEGAAQAHGGTAHGEPVGSLGTAAAFSLYGNKILTTGEGGMVTTGDNGVAALARELRDHGFSSERHFWHRLRAHSFRMSNVQAALGLAQVERLEELVATRRLTAGRYAEALHDIPGLGLPPHHPGLESLHWMFGITVGEHFGSSRDALRERLAAEGIETRTFFVPLHLQPAYRRENAGRRYPVAEGLGRTGLYLPSGPSVSEEDVARVAEAIRRTGSPTSAYTAPRSAAAAAGENRRS